MQRRKLEFIIVLAGEKGSGEARGARERDNF